MPDYRLMFDRNYIGHLDLAGKDVTLTISKVVGGELTAEGGRKSRKPIVHFSRDVKPMICNKTNAKTLAALYGNETAKWASKRVTLFTSMTRNPDGGGQVECVRIRPKVPGSGADTPIARQPEPEERIEATSPVPQPAAARVAGDQAVSSPADEVTAKGQPAAAPFTDDQIIEKLNKAATADALTEASELARTITDPAVKEKASQAYRATLKRLRDEQSQAA